MNEHIVITLSSIEFAWVNSMIVFSELFEIEELVRKSFSHMGYGVNNLGVSVKLISSKNDEGKIVSSHELTLEINSLQIIFDGKLKPKTILLCSIAYYIAELEIKKNEIKKRNLIKNDDQYPLWERVKDFFLDNFGKK